MSGISLRIRGEDSLTKWNAHAGVCRVCGREGLVLRYRRRPRGPYRPEDADAPVYRDLDWQVILSSTILGKAYAGGLTHGQGAGNIGITCGCYAKFMRQLAHIVDRWHGPGRDLQLAKQAGQDLATRINARMDSEVAVQLAELTPEELDRFILAFFNQASEVEWGAGDLRILAHALLERVSPTEISAMINQVKESE